MPWVLTGWVRGQTIELDVAVPELDGKRVRVTLLPIVEPESGAAEVAPSEERSGDPDREQ